MVKTRKASNTKRAFGKGVSVLIYQIQVQGEIDIEAGANKNDVCFFKS